jgi:hypothetical protein
MDPYIDTENSDEIISQLKSCKSLEEIKDLITRTFPNWMRHFYSTYSQDYPSLIFGYVSVCKNLNTTPKGIVLVDFIPAEQEIGKYTLLTKFLDTMTVNGFCVRKLSEFFPCNVCSALIPSKSIYTKLAFTKPECVPEKWSNRCRKCTS